MAATIAVRVDRNGPSLHCPTRAQLEAPVEALYEGRDEAASLT